MAGKGDSPRPLSVRREDFYDRFEKTLGGAKDTEPARSPADASASEAAEEAARSQRGPQQT